jgi:hypothetical protein
MPNRSPKVDRSFVSPDPVAPGPGGSLPDVPGVERIGVDYLDEPVFLAIVNQWSGGEGFYRIGLSLKDEAGQPRLMSVGGDDPELRHAVAYDFRADRPPLRQYLDVEVWLDDWGDIFVCLDVNGVEVHRYRVAIEHSP